MKSRQNGIVDLTEAQLSALRRLSVYPEYHISGKPQVRALITRGLAIVNEHRCTLITPAGLSALNDALSGNDAVTPSEPLPDAS